MARKKQKIPKALRDQVWLRHMGEVYKGTCKVRWCKNEMTILNFQCGHNIPESKGGATVLENLVPICSSCNQSMSNKYSIDEWNKLSVRIPWYVLCCAGIPSPADEIQKKRSQAN